MSKRKDLSVEIEQLLEENSYLQSIIAHMPGHVYWKDKKGAYLGCNEQQAKNAGFSSIQEMIGKNDYDVFSKEEADALRKVDLEVMQTGLLQTAEEIGMLADGTRGIFLSKKIPHYYKGEIIGIFGISFDITAQKAHEKAQQDQQLAELKEYLENIIALMPGHVYWKDKNSIYLGCNDLQAIDAGFKSKEEMMGKTDFDMSWKNQAAAIQKMDLEVMTTGIARSSEEIATLPNGVKATFLSKKSPHYRNGEIVGIVGISFDITAQKEAEALRVEQETLKRQVDTTKVLASTIAHELRTPLAAIYAGAEGTKDYLPDLINAYELAKANNLPVKKIRPSFFNMLTSAMDDIIDETRFANTFINMLLLNSEQMDLERKEFQVCSAAHCIEEALRRYPLQSGERELIQWEGNTDFNFNGSEVLMIHVLFNLLKNAIFYVKDAGKGNIAIRLKSGEKYNTLYFRDTGKGITADVLPNIFQLFFTKTYHGSGIGLSFCKIVMKSFGGDIQCESVPGEFTEFIMTFPTLD